VVLALVVVGILSVFGLAQASDDGSVPWPGPREIVPKSYFLNSLCPEGNEVHCGPCMVRTCNAVMGIG